MDFNGLILNFSLLTYENMLEDANKLLELAKGNSNQQKTLSACAIVLMAAALENCTLTIIENEAKKHSAENNKKVNQAPSYRFLHQSLRIRMKEIPNIISDSYFKFNNFNSHAKLLNEMISLRNKLVHFKDDTYAEIIGQDDSNIKVNITHSEQDSGYSIQIEGIKALENPWVEVSFSKALSCYISLKKYFTEIIEPYWANPTEPDLDRIGNSEMITK